MLDPEGFGFFLVPARVVLGGAPNDKTQIVQPVEEPGHASSFIKCRHYMYFMRQQMSLRRSSKPAEGLGDNFRFSRRGAALILVDVLSSQTRAGLTRNFFPIL